MKKSKDKKRGKKDRALDELDIDFSKRFKYTGADLSGFNDNLFQLLYDLNMNEYQ